MNVEQFVEAALPSQLMKLFEMPSSSYLLLFLLSRLTSVFASVRCSVEPPVCPHNVTPGIAVNTTPHSQAAMRFEKRDLYVRLISMILLLLSPTQAKTRREIAHEIEIFFVRELAV
jgi:hypothetical protein